jgi:poly(3-hydroxybutyrate) depolymerase
LPAAALAVALAGSGGADAAERLPRLGIDAAEVSVAGLSSGAFMANQIHVAHSAGIMGAALIAGGLYGCAAIEVAGDGVIASLATAMGPCSATPSLLDDVSAYRARVERLAQGGLIDPPSNLAHAKLYIFTGASDALVKPAAVEKARDLYLALGVSRENIVFEDKSGPAARAGHAWVTANAGGSCSANRAPYINNCGYDMSEAELMAIYGLGIAAPSPKASGRLVAFDQTEFVADKAARANGLSDTGYLYVPRACEPGGSQPCRLQVVLHGCSQSAETIGPLFATRIGLNELADTNGIVVLYPQAHATTLMELPPLLRLQGLQATNPLGCWNWWGYGGDPRFPTKNGVQVEAIWTMIGRLAEGR